MSSKGFRWNQIAVSLVSMSLRCWQVWVQPARLLDRVRVKVCRGSQAHWKKNRRGKISFCTKAEKRSHTEGQPCPVRELFQVSLSGLPSQMLDKRPISGQWASAVHKTIAGACASFNGDSWRVLMGWDMLGKEGPSIWGPYFVVMVHFKASTVFKFFIVLVY